MLFGRMKNKIKKVIGLNKKRRLSHDDSGESKIKTHYNWPIRTERLYDIFIVFTFKESGLDRLYNDDHHDDDHHDDDYHDDDHDEHHDDRRRRRLQVVDSPIF